MSQSTSSEMRINDLLISECLANHAMGRTNINDLERIEEMMMMEVQNNRKECAILFYV